MGIFEMKSASGGEGLRPSTRSLRPAACDATDPCATTVRPRLASRTHQKPPGAGDDKTTTHHLSVHNREAR